MNSTDLADDRTSSGQNRRLDGPGPVGSGLNLLRAMAAGEILPPPAMALLGIAYVAVRDGGATVRRKPGVDLYNPFGPVHGSAVAALLDLALGSAVQSALPAGQTYTTLDTRISYLRPLTAASGTLTAVARAIDVGEQRAVAEAQLSDADGQACATATMTCLLVETSEESSPEKPNRTWDVSDWFQIA